MKILNNYAIVIVRTVIENSYFYNISLELNKVSPPPPPLQRISSNVKYFR